MSKASNSFEKRVDLVFEGGGVKGIALVGALSVLEENGYKPQNVAGSSAGAIVATLLAAGYDAKSLGNILRTEKFNLYMDQGWEDKLLSKPRVWAYAKRVCDYLSSDMHEYTNRLDSSESKYSNRVKSTH
jgi:predicted acylesterase/phospholipase RssA